MREITTLKQKSISYDSLGGTPDGVRMSHLFKSASDFCKGKDEITIHAINVYTDSEYDVIGLDIFYSEREEVE